MFGSLWAELIFYRKCSHEMTLWSLTMGQKHTNCLHEEFLTFSRKNELYTDSFSFILVSEISQIQECPIAFIAINFSY